MSSTTASPAPADIQVTAVARLGSNATPDDAAALAELLAPHNISVYYEEKHNGFGGFAFIAPEPVVIALQLAATPIGSYLVGAFINGLTGDPVGKAGGLVRDAITARASRFRTFIADVLATSAGDRSPAQRVLIEEPREDRVITYVIQADIPDEAIEALLTNPLPPLPPGVTWCWHSGRAEWVARGNLA